RGRWRHCRCRICWLARASGVCFRLECGELVVLERNQPLQRSKLSIHVIEAGLQLAVVALALLQSFLARGELIAQSCGTAGSTALTCRGFVTATWSGDRQTCLFAVTAFASSGRRGTGVELRTGRRSAGGARSTAAAPGRRLLFGLLGSAVGGHGASFVRARQPHHGARLDQVDIVVDERTRVCALNRQHCLRNTDIASGLEAGRDLRQRVVNL